MDNTAAVTLIALDFQQGSSDKFYRVFTVDTDLITQYGRNGTFGTFTAAKPYPTVEAAEAAALKASAAKFAKGYKIVKTAAAHVVAPVGGLTPSQLDEWATLADSGPVDELRVPQEREQAPVVATVNEAAAFVRPTKTPMPMLAHNALSENVAGMILSPLWSMQPKLDGDRLLILVEDGVVSAYGRNGQAKVSNIGAAILAPFRKFSSGRWVFDGEVVGRVLWLFDLPEALPEADHIIGPSNSFATRYAALTAVVDVLGSEHVRLVPVADTPEEKAAMLADAQENRKEGVMFRLNAAPYMVGRSPALLKHKFVKTIDCVVIEAGRKGKDSASLGVFDHDGNLVEVGAASTIGKNKRGGGIKAGQVVEVEFLYILSQDDPRLYQPRIKSVRSDKAAAECSTDQLIGAHTNRDVA
jgi:ATP-dependent DNA ligase